MARRSRRIGWLLCACLLAGCVPASAVPPTPLPTSAPPVAASATPPPLATATGAPIPSALPACEPPSEWQATLALSGGFAGVARSITVSRAGDVTARDERSGANSSDDLSGMEIAALESWLCAALEAPAPGRPGPCADCFGYSLEITAAGYGNYSRTWNDLTLRDDPAAPFVQALLKLLDSLLAPG